MPETTDPRTWSLDTGYPFLAKAATPCPESDNHQYMAGMPEGGGAEDGAICADCNGTSVVPLLPGLREDCAGCRGTGYMAGNAGYGPCPDCKVDAGVFTGQGRGWVPVRDPMAVVKAMRRAGFALQVSVDGEWRFIYAGDRVKVGPTVQKGGSFKLVIVRAACLAVKAYLDSISKR